MREKAQPSDLLPKSWQRNPKLFIVGHNSLKEMSAANENAELASPKCNGICLCKPSSPTWTLSPTCMQPQSKSQRGQRAVVLRERFFDELLSVREYGVDWQFAQQIHYCQFRIARRGPSSSLAPLRRENKLGIAQKYDCCISDTQRRMNEGSLIII